MKVKMFAGSGNAGDLEREINEWLSSQKIQVSTIKQSCACDGKTCFALVSVWYESTESVNKI